MCNSVYVCVHAMYVHRANPMDTTCIPMYKMDVFQFLRFIDKGVIAGEAIRSMAGKIWKKVRHLSSSKVRKNIF